MPRPRICRRVRFNPELTYFKPQGKPLGELEEVNLSVDEFEAIRLKDFESLGQEECAKRMNISQPTFHRILTSARKTISDALLNGKAIKIGGGNYRLENKKR